MSMTLPARLTCGIAALGLCATLGACNNDPGNGTVRVQYAFDSFTSCNEDAENVVEIMVEIGDSVATETVACDNAGGEITVSAPAGTYDILVQGIDDVGDPVIDNLNDPTTDDRVEFIGGDDKDFPVELGLIPARLEIIMQVINTGSGFPAMCGSTDIMIRGVEVEAASAAGGLKSHAFDLCDFTDIVAVPDEDREINGRLFDRVFLQPIDETGASVGDEIEIQFAQPVGAGKSVRIALTCEGDSCTYELLEGEVGTTTDDPTGDPTGGSDTDPGTTTGDPTGTGGGDTTGGGSTGA